MSIKNLALGIDIGGTNITFGVTDKTGHVYFEDSFLTSTISSPENLAPEISQKLQGFELKSQIIGIGIGAPNGNFNTGMIDNAPNLNWGLSVPLKSFFQKEFNLPVYLTNDANAAAIGEKLFGAAKKLSDFVEVTLGTGLGSGLYIDETLIYGSQSLAGEFGHIRVEKNGRTCGCGRKGCLETYASATGIVRSIQELNHPEKQNSLIFQHKSPTAKEVTNLAINGDLYCLYIIDYTAEILGSALADFACFSNPKAYILFGGVANSGTFFSEKVKFHMEQNILNIYANQIEIITSQLLDSNAAILGAASLVFHFA